jgi:hypothetical protein
VRRLHRTDHAQPAIVKALRGYGDYVAIIGRPVDLLVRLGMWYVTMEVKTPGKDVKREQPTQVVHREDAAAHKAPHFVVSSVDEAIAVREKFLWSQIRTR